jgi:hypothetical protein
MSSRLRPSLFDYDEQAIAHHIENIERRIRIMCRVSQVYNNHDGVQVSTITDHYADMAAWNEVFYEYVDHQMDGLKILRDHLEREFHWISLQGLRDGEDFRAGKGCAK